MRRTPMLRREFESSPSPLVCTTIVMDSNTATANRTKELELDEEGTRISLTIVDTPGFGDQIDNEARQENTSKRYDTAANTSNSFGEIVGYLERQYDDILAEESRIKRNPRFRDNRVHALLYFITPTGHGYVLTSSAQNYN